MLVKPVDTVKVNKIWTLYSIQFWPKISKYALNAAFLETVSGMANSADPESSQGPVVQSVVSLTSSLRVISLNVLAASIYNILEFFAEKIWVALALQKLLTFFQQNISAYLHITWCKF